MNTKLDIFSSEKLKFFFTNLDSIFDISFKNLHEIKSYQNSTRLSVVFFDEHKLAEDKIIKNILQNENFIFVFKDFNRFGKLSIDFKQTISAPLSISKFFDKVNDIVNKKKLTFKNIDLNNSFVTNNKTKETTYLTQAENLILTKLISEKNVNKKLLEREVLHIKEDLNTYSMESHLNRIRKKLKKLDSDFSLSSKGNDVILDIIDHNK